MRCFAIPTPISSCLQSYYLDSTVIIEENFYCKIPFESYLPTKYIYLNLTNCNRVNFLYLNKLSFAISRNATT